MKIGMIVVIGPIALGVLRLKAAVGEVIPRGKRGRGNKKISHVIGDFNKNTETAYRKLHANVDRLDEYYEAIENVPEEAIDEARGGELLAEMAERPKLGGDNALPPNDEPTLADLGINSDQSSRWQRIATVPEEVIA